MQPFLSTRFLAVACLVFSLAGITCCWSIPTPPHWPFGRPISIEFEYGNPLAVAVFAMAFLASGNAAVLHGRPGNWIDSVLMGMECAGIVVMVATSPESSAHDRAFLFTAGMILLAPLLHVIRHPFDVGGLFAAALTLAGFLFFGIQHLMPSTAVDIALAAKCMFTARFGFQAWILNLAGLAAGYAENQSVTPVRAQRGLGCRALKRGLRRTRL